MGPWILLKRGSTAIKKLKDIPVKNILKIRQNSNLRHKTTAYLLHL
jgi:hypothetical protein